MSFPATFSAAKTLLDALESHEHLLEKQIELANQLFLPYVTDESLHLVSNLENHENSIQNPDFSPTKLVVNSSGKTFKYDSLDEILSRVMTEEDYLNMDSVSNETKKPEDGDLSKIEYMLANSIDQNLVAGLKKLQEYYDLSKKYKKDHQESCMVFLKSLETSNQKDRSQFPQDVIDLATNTLASINVRGVPECEIPRRFNRDHQTKESRRLIDEVQNVIRQTVAVDLASVDVDTPGLPAIFRAASILNNLEKPPRLIFMKND